MHVYAVPQPSDLRRRPVTSERRHGAPQAAEKDVKVSNPERVIDLSSGMMVTKTLQTDYFRARLIGLYRSSVPPQGFAGSRSVRSTTANRAFMGCKSSMLNSDQGTAHASKLQTLPES